MKSLFTNKLLMTAHRVIEDRQGRGISTKLGFNTQVMIIHCILEMDEHEHKRLILCFKAQLFCVVV